jgi:hypothetical protein
MGDYDVVKAVLGRIADMTWMQIAIKPAKPFAFGTTRRHPVFGLPGNPVSSLVSFELLARPALAPDDGPPPARRPSLVAVADAALERQPDGKVHFVRVNGEFGDDGRYHVTARSERRGVTSSPPPRSPMRWPSCPTATVSLPAPTSRRAPASRVTQPVGSPGPMAHGATSDHATHQ